MHEGEGGEMSATRRAVADSTATSSRKGVQMEEQTGRREKGWRERWGVSPGFTSNIHLAVQAFSARESPVSSAERVLEKY